MPAGRPKNGTDSIAVTITVPEQVQRALVKLVEHGTFGKNRSEVCLKIISDKINDLVHDGTFLKVSDLEVPRR